MFGYESCLAIVLFILPVNIRLKELSFFNFQAMEEWQTTVEKQRYSRLQHLLQKSNVYSSFLLQRIEEQKVENEKKKARDAKKAEKINKEDNKESPQTVSFA